MIPPVIPPVVRPALPGDLAAVVALERDGLGADAWSEELVSAGLAGLPTVRYLVAEVGGEVIGHAVVSVVDEVAELQRIAVRAARRRTHVGWALLSAVAEHAAAEGAGRLLLEVREDNEPALRFYAAAGFAELDRRPRYYRDGATALVLQRDLAEFPVRCVIRTVAPDPRNV